MRRALAIGLLVLCSCDGGAATEIVLVVDTDIADVDAFEVDAIYPSGGTGSSTADLGVAPAPRTLVLFKRGGALGPLRLTIAATRGGTRVLAVEREVTFEEGQSLTLNVFLADACTMTACAGASETCGDDGACRSRVVAPCEYAGRGCGMNDAGMPEDAGDPPDAGDRDGGPCDLTAVCGAPASLLPGDVIEPAPCAPIGPAATVTVTGPGGVVSPLATDPSQYRLVASGPHAVRLETSATCALEVTSTVVAPIVNEDTGVASGELRDFDARVGMGFVAGATSAYAVDATRWVDLLDGSIASGSVPSPPLRAVAVHAGQPIFGPDADRDAVYRGLVDVGATRVDYSGIAFGGGDTTVRAIAARVDDLGELAVATVDRFVVIADPSGSPSPIETGSGYDLTSAGWIAVGMREPPTRGAVWAGHGDVILNRTLDDSGALFNFGNTAAIPPALGTAHAAALDDRDAATPRLWLCGESGVFLYAITGDWNALSVLPAPTQAWTGTCRDLAIAEDGHAWVATGTALLVRLGPDGTEVATYDAADGLDPDLATDFVAAAWDIATREVWTLDASRRAIQVLSASTEP